MLIYKFTRNKEVFERCRSESPRHTEKLKEEYKDKPTANDVAEWLDKNTGDVILRKSQSDKINIPTVNELLQNKKPFNQR